MTCLTLPQLTTVALDGTGVFDKLMEAVELHIDQEYKRDRIKGAEYSTVYLAALQAVLAQSVEWLVQSEQVCLLRKQAELIDQQVLSAVQETANLAKQGELLDVQILDIIQGTLLKVEQTATEAQNALNAVTQNLVIIAQECKLKAEFDVLVLQKDKVIAETALINQRRLTEQAQTSGTSIDAGSVLGKQITLYERQADSFLRAAEQKAASLMIDTWNLRRSMDVAYPDSDAGLDNPRIKVAVDKLINGIP